MSKGTARTATRQTAGASTNEHANTDQAAITIDGETRGKFVLFAIPAGDRVEDGPVMRGLLETDQGKVNVAAWKKLARDSGNEYLSLKVGNAKRRDENTPDGAPDEWLVGPFYGRLFKEVTSSGDSNKTRYFGFVEDSVKVCEDAKTAQGHLQDQLAGADQGQAGRQQRRQEALHRRVTEPGRCEGGGARGVASVLSGGADRPVLVGPIHEPLMVMQRVAWIGLVSILSGPVWTGSVAPSFGSSRLNGPSAQRAELDFENAQHESLLAGALEEVCETVAACFGFDDRPPDR